MTYEPDLGRIWNGCYPLGSPPDPFQLYYVDRQFGLGPEWARCRDRPILRFVLERGTIEVELGPQSSIATAVLAPLSALTRLNVVVARYQKHTDYGMLAEPVSGIRITFRSGRKFMKFLRSDWGEETWYNSREYLASLQAIADAAGARYSQRACRSQMSYEYP